MKSWPAFFSTHGRFITTNLVVAETFTFLRYELGFAVAWQFLDRVEQTSRLEIVRSDSALESSAKSILEQYRDQSFSYTDAISFAVMSRLELTDAFAFDSHFLIAGFTALP